MLKYLFLSQKMMTFMTKCKKKKKNIVQPQSPQMTIKYYAEKMRFVCRISKAGMQTQNHCI